MYCYGLQNNFLLGRKGLVNHFLLGPGPGEKTKMLGQDKLANVLVLGLGLVRLGGEVWPKAFGKHLLTWSTFFGKSVARQLFRLLFSRNWLASAFDAEWCPQRAF